MAVQRATILRFLDGVTREVDKFCQRQESQPRCRRVRSSTNVEGLRTRGEQADRYIDALTAAFTDLAESPTSAPASDQIRPGYRRRSVERHMIYFRITTYGIAILRVLHDRMDAPRHL